MRKLFKLHTGNTHNNALLSNKNTTRVCFKTHVLSGTINPKAVKQQNDELEIIGSNK